MRREPHGETGRRGKVGQIKGVAARVHVFERFGKNLISAICM